MLPQNLIPITCELLVTRLNKLAETYHSVSALGSSIGTAMRCSAGAAILHKISNLYGDLKCSKRRMLFKQEALINQNIVRLSELKGVWQLAAWVRLAFNSRPKKRHC